MLFEEELHIQKISIKRRKKNEKEGFSDVTQRGDGDLYGSMRQRRRK